MSDPIAKPALTKAKPLFRLDVAPTFTGTVTVADLDGSSQELDCVFHYASLQDREKILSVEMRNFDNTLDVVCQIVASVGNAPDEYTSAENPTRAFFADLLPKRPWVFRDVLGAWLEALETGRTKN